MVTARFNGDIDNSNYQCAEFNARINDTVKMPNARWAAIGTDGKQGLFTFISEDAATFPAQTTIGPRV